MEKSKQFVKVIYARWAVLFLLIAITLIVAYIFAKTQGVAQEGTLLEYLIYFFKETFSPKTFFEFIAS